jgi:hypothetical protein
MPKDERHTKTHVGDDAPTDVNRNDLNPAMPKVGKKKTKKKDVKQPPNPGK